MGGPLDSMETHAALNIRMTRMQSLQMNLQEVYEL